MFLCFWITFILTYGSVSAIPLLELDVDGPLVDAETADILLGQKTVHKATITFTNESLQDVSIGVFSPSNTTYFAFGGQPYIEIGTDLTITKEVNGQNLKIATANYFYFLTTSLGPEYKDPSLPVQYETAFELPLGNITGIFNSTDSKIDLEIEYYYVSNGGVAEDILFYPAIAMEYTTDEGTFLLIGNIEYNLKDELLHVTSLELFEADMTEDPVRGLPSIDLNMNIPFSLSFLQVEVAFKDESKDVIVSEMNVKFLGDSFNPVDKTKIYSYTYSECPITKSLVLHFGSLLNKDAFEDPERSSRNLVVVEAILQSLDVELNGTEVEIVIGIYIERIAIWLGSVKVTVAHAPLTPLAFTTYIAIAHQEYQTPSPGFPGVAEITLTIPEHTRNEYKFNFTTSSLSASENALSILGMTMKSAGYNIDCDTRTTSSIALTLLESTQESGLFDKATVSLNISNYNFQTNPTEESNLVIFYVYVKMLPTAVKGDIHRLTVNINDVEAQNVDFTAGNQKSYHDNPYYKDNLENDCATDTFFADTTMTFTINVTTERNSTVGPVTYETVIPDDLVSLFDFITAKIIWRGRNVGCVNAGDVNTVVSDWIEGSGEQDRVLLTFPLVCNIEVVDSDIEDTFTLEMKLKLKKVTGSADNQKFILERKHVGDEEFFVYNFNIKASTDFGKTLRIEGATIPLDMPSAVENGAFIYKLQWSENNRDFHDYTQNWDIQNVVNGSYTVDRPLYARYVRLLDQDSGCTTDYSLTASDFGDDIDFYGAHVSKENMLRNIMYVLDDDKNTCKPLPTKNTKETVTYYWSSIKTSIFNSAGQSAFSVELTGKGLACIDANTPQKTKVMYPKNIASRNFSGIWSKCTPVKKHEGSPMTCVYNCECSSATTCAGVTLLLYYDGNPNEQYELCEVKVIETD